MTDCKRCAELERQLAEAEKALLWAWPFVDTITKLRSPKGTYEAHEAALTRQKQREQEER